MLLPALGGCSAEASSGTRSRAVQGSPSSAAGSSGASAGGSGAAAAGAACAAGSQASCYCPDGTTRGTQSCSAQGTLGVCDCATSQAPLEDGAVCSMLQGQSGCSNSSFRSEELPASVLLVVDRSGSMNCNTPEDGQSSAECEAQAIRKDQSRPSKWEITRAALEQVIADLVGSSASVGLAFFSNDDVCGVHSRPSVPIAAMTSDHAAAMTTALAAIVPSGGTPLVGATTLAYAYLHEEASAVDGQCASPPCGARGNRFVVLITDGEDSCPSEPVAGACAGGSCSDHLLDVVSEDAVAVNIRTFVIGAPGSEPARGFLSELAYRGGTARAGGQCVRDRNSEAGDCHFDMTTSTDFASDLASALTQISGSALGCEFPVPATPSGLTANVNVQYRAGGMGAPMCLGKDDAPCDGGASGWQFARKADGSEDLAKVVLCGDACAMVKNDPAIQVDVVLGCTPIVVD